MEMVRLKLLLSLLLTMAVTACGRVATSPSPEVTLAPTQRPTATAQPSPTPSPQTIPGGVMTVALASKGDFIVTGEVEGTTGLAYFLDSAGWLYLFDGASLEVVASAQVLAPLEEYKPYDLAVDGEIGRVYVADGARGEILVLDSETLSPLGRIDAYGRITVDPITRRLYIAQVGVYIADGERGEIIDRIEETIPEEGTEIYSGVHRGVDVYINPVNRHLYVMMDNNTPGSNSRHWLDLYDADDYTLLAKQVPWPYGSSSAPDFDSKRGLDYVSGYHPMTGDQKLVALNTEGREVDHLWGVGGEVFFSPRRDLIYMAGWEGLDVVEAKTMNYLDFYPLKVTLHDPRNGRFYSLGWQEPTVTIFDEPTVSLAPRRATSVLRGRLPTLDLGEEIDSLVLSPAFSSDKSLFVASGTSIRGTAVSISLLFASSDGGDSWREITLPFLNRGRMRVALSPAYAHDRMLLVGLACEPAGSGIMRSTDGGLHWARVNGGLTDLGIEALVFSPHYAQDKTIFARGCFDGVFKSIDGGTTWRPLTADLPTDEGSERVNQLVVSPAYARDGVLWILTPSHVYRSKDGGESWERADQGLEGLKLWRLVLSPDYEVDKTALVTVGQGVYITRNGGEEWQPIGLPISGLWVTHLALSPDFASDGVLFVGGRDKEQGYHLYRSTDGGKSWLAVWEFSSEWIRGVALSPRYPADGLVFASTDRGVYRSTDGGATWKPVNLPGAWATLFVFSPDFASDHTIYASLGQVLYRSQDGGENWTALHESAAAMPTPLPTVTPMPTPTLTPTRLSCPGLDPVFRSIADRVESLRPNFTDLPNPGCPTNPAQTIGGAGQMFLMQAPGSTVSNPPGYMIWSSDSRTIYVIPQGDSLTGRSEALVYDDTWSEGMPEIPPSCAGLTPPTGLQIPIRGFGKVWCDNSLYDRIGFGYGSEKAVDLLIQEAERGLYISLPEVGNFVIDVVNGLALSE